GQLFSSPATVNLTVISVNNAPIAANDSATTPEDTPITINVRTNDFDADGDPLTVQIMTQPAHGTVTINGAGNVVYTPDADYNGPDSFTYRVNDGTTNSNTATVNL